jgi:hypothetical protein
MIVVVCPGCGKKLQAKPEWAGRTGKCATCGRPVRIPVEIATPSESIPLDDAAPGEQIVPAIEEHIAVFLAPERLDRESHYLICDRTHLVATWENNGSGWMIRSGNGFAPAKRNHDKLPSSGEFQLVELKFAKTPDGKRLSAMIFYHLASRWALTTLDQGDDVILEKIVGHGCLNTDQKIAVRQALNDQFMRPVWHDATAIVEYLGNLDYHSHRVEAAPQPSSVE